MLIQVDCEMGSYLSSIRLCWVCLGVLRKSSCEKTEAELEVDKDNELLGDLLCHFFHLSYYL